MCEARVLFGDCSKDRLDPYAFGLSRNVVLLLIEESLEEEIEV